MKNIFSDIMKNRKGSLHGLYSACTANEIVIEAVMERAKETNTPALIEATANQVNQFGGYTGMVPADYAAFVSNIARKMELPPELLILGGDHLGPLNWVNLSEEEAMANSEELIKQYVKAGFTKIHIDTSMRLSVDDKTTRLSDDVIANRAIRLIKTAEEAYYELLKTQENAVEPVYVIGSEVPIPGGAQEDESVQVTSVTDFEAAYNTYKSKFIESGLNSVWSRVIAFVIQPGVEFGDESIHEYNSNKAEELISALHKYNGLVFEGHSTDYQTKYKLKEMVDDGIAILKVGPALTFALREAILSLALIEKELLDSNGVRLSRIEEVLEDVMLENTSNWKRHYHGDNLALKFKRKYSYSDRCRYYLPEKEVNHSLNILISNLDNAQIPLSLLSQYMPIQYINVREGKLAQKTRELIKDRVKNCIDDYLYAVMGH